MSQTRALETITAAVMEPLMDGSFREAEATKRAHQCLGCGLVWAIRWHAETCEERGHRARWQQRYVTGPIINGKPRFERFYPRTALRREPLPS